MEDANDREYSDHLLNKKTETHNCHLDNIHRVHHYLCDKGVKKEIKYSLRSRKKPAIYLKIPDCGNESRSISSSSTGS